MKDSKTVSPTSVKIDEQGTLIIFEKTEQAAVIKGRSWKTAIANGKSVFALGAAGTVVEIDKNLTIHTFDKKVKDAIDILWANNTVTVVRENGFSDIFVDGKFVKTIEPPVTPTPSVTQTPTNTPTPTCTPTPSATNELVLQKLNVQPNAEAEPVKTSIPTIKQIKESKQIGTDRASTPVCTPTTTPSVSFSVVQKETDPVKETEQRSGLMSKVFNWFK